MSTPLTPTWPQPSHPTIQKVLITSTSSTEFSTKSISTIDVPPFGLYAKLEFPPCTRAEEATYATVQMDREEHLNLNSDLVYVNHSCEPSVIFDTTSLSILAGPKGLHANQELTFFYPSTEWSMAQPFTCFCSTPSCKGIIDGAKNMSAEKLEGMWLNVHIREMIEERDALSAKAGNGSGSGVVEGLLRENLRVAEKGVVSARRALDGFLGGLESAGGFGVGARGNGVSSRELSGEMDGDTKVGA